MRRKLYAIKQIFKVSITSLWEMGQKHLPLGQTMIRDRVVMVEVSVALGSTILSNTATSVSFGPSVAVNSVIPFSQYNR